MGTDPTHNDSSPVNVGSASRSDLLAAVRAGRLWLNVLHVDRADSGFAQLQDELSGELAAAGSTSCPAHRIRRSWRPHRRDGLLPCRRRAEHPVARPRQETCLGYPPGNESFIDRKLVEDIYVGVRTEFLPYRPEFDDAALTFDLHPGDTLSWAQNSPHRVQNLGVVNVSLTCEFDTPATRRRHLVYAANRFFSRTWHLPVRSTQVTGTGAAVKRLAYRACRKAGLERVQVRHDHITRLRIDGAAPNGVIPLAQPTHKLLSRLRSTSSVCRYLGCRREGAAAGSRPPPATSPSGPNPRRGRPGRDPNAHGRSAHGGRPTATWAPTPRSTGRSCGNPRYTRVPRPVHRGPSPRWTSAGRGSDPPGRSSRFPSARSLPTTRSPDRARPPRESEPPHAPRPHGRLPRTGGRTPGTGSAAPSAARATARASRTARSVSAVSTTRYCAPISSNRRPVRRTSCRNFLRREAR